MNLKIIFLRIRIKFCKEYNPEDFNKILRYKGLPIGKGTIFYAPKSQIIDTQRPWMLSVGEYCKITQGCTILAHDYSRSVLRRAYHDIVGEAGKTKIGNNVFVGMHSIILMGTQIGNNVIIGAGSVVSGNIPDNVVVAGNPAKIIRTLDEHYDIRKQKMFDEAKLYVTTFKETYNRLPTESEMGPFFSLFLRRDVSAIKEKHISLRWNGDDSSEILNDFLKSEQQFASYEIFLQAVFAEKVLT